jgi:hypothetical protein
VLLPAPGRRPALRSYQEAGQLLGGRLRGWQEMVFDEKSTANDSKTGNRFCSQFVQNHYFARFLGKGFQA